MLLAPNPIAVKLRKPYNQNKREWLVSACIGIRPNSFYEVSKRLSSKINDFLSTEQISAIARDTQFVQRSSQLSGERFLDLLLFTRFENKKTSLNDLACQLESLFKIQLSKQALDQRFNGFAVLFLKSLLEKFIADQLKELPAIIPVRNFPSIRIKDSTCFQLPEHLVEIYPGSGGSGSKAAIRIQFEYDLVSGRIIDLSLHPFNEQDTVNAQKELDTIKQGELVIRDLGYINLSCLSEIDLKNAFYLNRLKSKIVVYESSNGKLSPIDFDKIRKHMDKKKITRMEKEVFLGKDKKVFTRLIIERMPEDKVKERIRKARKEAKKKGRTISDQYISRAYLNLFITNTDPQVLGSQYCNEIYSIRWQIELIFKIWKSVVQIHQVKMMKRERLECFLYAKLLWITMNWEILMRIYHHLWTSRKVAISFIKAYQTFLIRMEKQRKAFYSDQETLQEYILEMVDTCLKYHVIEKRKDKRFSVDIIGLIINLL